MLGKQLREAATGEKIWRYIVYSVTGQGQLETCLRVQFRNLRKVDVQRKVRKATITFTPSPTEGGYQKKEAASKEDDGTRYKGAKGVNHA